MTRALEIESGKFAHCSGALWLPESRTAILADVHLGYGWAQRRRGQLGPTEDGGVRIKLESLVQELAPRTVVLLGDVVHAPRPGARERTLVEETLSSIAGITEVVVVRGNHDRAFARDYQGLGLRVVECWMAEGLMAIHGDRPPANCPSGSRLILGHLHPAVGVRDDAGASQRIPVFLVGSRGCVLPAFSPFAAGFDVKTAGLPQDVRRLVGGGSITCIAATGKRVVKLGPLALLRQHQ